MSLADFYDFVEQKAPGVVFIDYFEGGKRGWVTQLWIECKTRKEHRCVISGETFPSRSKMYRPFGNPSNRYQRIAGQVVDRWIAGQEFDTLIQEIKTEEDWIEP